MKVDLFSDTHIHTSLCRHASGTMEEYVRGAIDRGLTRLVFLEHLEEGINVSFRTWLTEEDFDVYFEEGRRLQQRYGEEIEVGLGVEVGYNPDCTDRILQRLAHRSWDRIGLSCHFFKVDGCEEHLNVLSKNRRTIDIIERCGPNRLLSRYFSTLTEGVRRIPANVLCHLDAGLRHQPNLQLEKSHWEQIDILLDEVKRAGMALEINTSGYKYRGLPFPLPEIIALAAAKAIPLALGSDAHSPSEVGRYFDRIPALLG
ncbi:MAG: histidinol-phosphatase HisJ family protein [Desulfofustis sp.]|nr:histidinol-phosphatase HisJ family protein [Desulfofustis sp.]MBT8345311.1 histidinol-phosphatase HisJ family protein [Desulfofustis sp.]NNK14509.1 histidinol-phosphatase HisJ family protein [Desulfofustis sp.]NNK58909.1 histidinol-phosphatase HisJ family protein [Desulfofustis sp.]